MLAVRCFHRQDARRRYISYSKDLEVFHSTGTTLHRWGWNLVWTKGRRLQGEFHPHQCRSGDVGPPKWRFYAISEYKSLTDTGAYPLRSFHENFRVSGPLHGPLIINIWGFAQGVGSHTGLVGVRFPPNFQRPLAAKLYVGSENVLEKQERHEPILPPCQVWRCLDFARRQKTKKFRVFLRSFR